MREKQLAGTSVITQSNYPQGVLLGGASLDADSPELRPQLLHYL